MRSCCRPRRDTPSLLQGAVPGRQPSLVAADSQEPPMGGPRDEVRFGARGRLRPSRSGSPACHMRDLARVVWFGGSRAWTAGRSLTSKAGRDVRAGADDRVSSRASVRPGTPRDDRSTGSSSAPVRRPHPGARPGCMERDRRKVTAAFHGCTSAWGPIARQLTCDHRPRRGATGVRRDRGDRGRSGAGVCHRRHFSRVLRERATPS